MGLRFRKSISLGKGIKLNLSKKSIGLSAGAKGARLSANSSGRFTKSANIPGTGISYVSTSKFSGKKNNAVSGSLIKENLNVSKFIGSPSGKPSGIAKVILCIIIGIIGIVLIPYLWILLPIPAVIYLIKSKSEKKNRNIVITAIVCVVSLICFIGIMGNREKNDDSLAVAKSETTISTTAETTTKIETSSPETLPKQTTSADTAAVESTTIITTISTTSAVTTAAQTSAALTTNEQTSTTSLAVIATTQATTIDDPDSQVTVYITKTGKRYHYDNNCNGGTYYASTLAEAKKRGLTPCEKCVLH